MSILDATERTTLVSPPSPQISNQTRRIIYVVSFVAFTCLAVAGVSELGWSCKTLGNNSCTILSATALSIGVIGLIAMGWIRNNYPSCSGFRKGTYLNP